MTCDDVRERLDGYVDGALSEAQFQELELHLHACPACRAEERALRALLAEAASLPRAVEPPRDLWPGIAARIGDRKTVVRLLPRPSWWLSPAPLAAAAAVVLAVAAALLRTPTIAGPGAALSGTPVTLASEPAQLRQAEAEYARATSELVAALDARRGDLPPETLKVVDENLRIIDEALKQVREALRQSPENQALAHMLRATHQKKVEVLRRALKLKA